MRQWVPRCDLCGLTDRRRTGIRDRLCLCGRRHRICARCSVHRCGGMFYAPGVGGVLRACPDGVRVADALMGGG